MINPRYLGTGVGSPNISVLPYQVVLGYPCVSSGDTCAPYELKLSPGSYRFEAWGSAGDAWQSLTPGLGAYTAGIIDLKKEFTFYVFVGAKSLFNSMLVAPYRCPYPGAATDVRLNYSAQSGWSDSLSLRSRIFIAGGGGGAEWVESIGGNGGLNGSRGYSDCANGKLDTSFLSTGGTQIKGGTGTKDRTCSGGTVLDGKFGISSVTTEDMGGIGGSGYYSGATVEVTGGGGGGSSFISGHPGCIAIKSDKSEAPSNSPIHYSNIVFRQTKVIDGNNTMPLYYSPKSKGIGNSGRGAFRITILIEPPSCLYENPYLFSYEIPIFIFFIIDS